MNKKNLVLILFAWFLLGIPQFALANENTEGPSALWKMETQGWSIEDHMAAAKAKEQKVQTLESRVQEMEERLADIEEKPYFDPKGLQRSGLKLLAGKMKGKVNVLNERIAWHYRQADHAELVK